MYKIIFFLLVIFSSCNKKEVGPQYIDGTPYYKEKGGKVVISCEGNFGWGNASISVYNTKTNQVFNNVFNTQNNQPIGDVLQSSSLFNGDLFLVVNNSNKIEVIDTSNFSIKGTITGLVSPRYFLGITPSKAYVSDLHSNKITIVNPSNFQKTGYIDVSAWTEQMILYNQYVYVAQKGTNQVLVIDSQNDMAIDSITVGREPNSLVLDAFNNIWVLCSGGVNETTPSLCLINTINNTVIKELVFNSINQSPSNLQIDTSKTNLYYINNGIYKQSISLNNIDYNSKILQTNGIFYGLGINPFNSEIYISDAIDYIQQGKVYRYSNSLELIDSFSTGIIPQDFTFLEN